jgi:hypothetical protein
MWSRARTMLTANSALPCPRWAIVWAATSRTVHAAHRLASPTAAASARPAGRRTPLAPVSRGRESWPWNECGRRAVVWSCSRTYASLL